MTAVEKLHAHVFKGVQISAILKKRADNAARSPPTCVPRRSQSAKRCARRSEEQRKGHHARPSSPRSTSPAGSSSAQPALRRQRGRPPLHLPPFGPVYEITIPKVKAKQQPDEAKPDSNAKQKETAFVNKMTRKTRPTLSRRTTAIPTAKMREGDEDAEDRSESDSEQDDEADDDDARRMAASPRLTPRTKLLRTRPTLRQTPTSKRPPLPSLLPSLLRPSRLPSKRSWLAFVWMVLAQRCRARHRGSQRQQDPTRRRRACRLQVCAGSRGRRAAKLRWTTCAQTPDPSETVAVDWALSKKDWEAKADESEPEQDDKANDDATMLTMPTTPAMPAVMPARSPQSDPSCQHPKRAPRFSSEICRTRPPKKSCETSSARLAPALCQYHHGQGD